MLTFWHMPYGRPARSCARRRHWPAFPNTDPAYEGADSMVLLSHVMQLVRNEGLSFWTVIVRCSHT